MSEASTKAYYAHKQTFPTATDKLRWLIQKHPGIQYPALEKHMGKEFSKFSGRISGLKAKGEVWVDDSGEFSKHYYEHDKAMQGLRKERFEYEEKLRKIKLFVDHLTGELTERGLAELRLSYANIREKLKLVEQDIVTQNLIN